MADTTTGTGVAGTTPATPKYPKREPKEVWIKRRYTKPILPEEDMMENSAINYKLYLGSAYAGFGSTILLGRTIWDNEKQEKEIMGQVIGMSTSSTDWETTLNAYWKNFLVPIPFEGKKVNASVEYTADGVYKPINVEDYVLYRYALKHSVVANRKEDVNKGRNIMFYLWDAQEEKLAQLKELTMKDRATTLRMEISGDYTKASAILQVAKGTQGLSPDDLKLEIAAYAEAHPGKFVKIATDADLLDKAFIETAVYKGIFIRPVNSHIVIYENMPIGNNLDEAVAWLRNPANAPTKSIIEAKLKSKN